MHGSHPSNNPEGITEIHDVYHIDRGYDNLDGKLVNLGAKLWREEVE